MKQALIIAKMTLLMTYRKGTLLGISLVVALLSTLVFNVARSDGQIINELEIRLAYSYGMSYSVLSLIIISLACFTMRSQLDAKNIHMLTSYPISRKWILIGQALGLVGVALFVEFVLFATLAGNVWFFTKDSSVEQKTLVEEKFFKTRREVLPAYKSRRDIAIEYGEELEIDIPALNGEQWNELFERALRAEQLISPGKSKKWSFELNEGLREASGLDVVYRFQQADRRQKIKGLFELKSEAYSIYYQKEIIADQYADESFSIPSEYIPPDGKFSLVFTNQSGLATIITRTGMKCSYQKGTFYGNILKAGMSQIFHLTVTILVGLCAGAGLTFSVATFFVMMLYFMSIAEGIVRVVIEDYGFAATITFWDKAAMSIMNLSMWLTKGLQPPEVISMMSSGIDIQWQYLYGEWLPATLFYGVVALFIGARIIESKELDKIQS
jgi:hypothetical protein